MSEIDIEEYNRIASLLKAMGDSTRLRILGLLKTSEFCVCQIQSILGLSQSNVSQHLFKLKAEGLVRERRSSQWIYYSISERMPEIARCILNQIPEVMVDSRNDNGTCEVKNE
ncbi:ArsR/SmtB family transcription factor [Cuniculiplasma sp. SKW3]|uniref:ArsR/SmtB family transcription factor n=1 Tax=Cuniculiplasma sp. SKW3 TaxID=3400170 RepID=UPI003FD2EA91